MLIPSTQDQIHFKYLPIIILDLTSGFGQLKLYFPVNLKYKDNF